MLLYLMEEKRLGTMQALPGPHDPFKIQPVGCAGRNLDLSTKAFVLVYAWQHSALAVLRVPLLIACRA